MDATDVVTALLADDRASKFMPRVPAAQIHEEIIHIPWKFVTGTRWKNEGWAPFLAPLRTQSWVTASFLIKSIGRAWICDQLFRGELENVYPNGGFLLKLEGRAPGIPVPSWDQRCFLRTGRLRMCGSGSSPIMDSTSPRKKSDHYRCEITRAREVSF